jgi:hypothetical protein
MTVIPFAQAAPLDEYERTVELHKLGPNHMNIPALGYLVSIRIENETPLQDVQLTECNGMPIFRMSGKHFALLNNTIPLEINPDTGLGCLPNLTAHALYRLILRGEGKCRIVYTHRRLPSQTNEQGVTQEVVPPRAGTMQSWTEWYGGPYLAGENSCTIRRTGNIFRQLLCCFDPADTVVSDLEAWFGMHLGVAMNKVPNVECELIQPGCYSLSFPHGLATTVSSELLVRWQSSKGAELTILINDYLPPPHG